MTDKKKPNYLNKEQSSASDSSSTESETENTPVLKSNRRSKRLNKKDTSTATATNRSDHSIESKSSSNNKSKKSSKKKQSNSNDLGTFIQNEFNYTLRDGDFLYIKHFFTGLPRLYNTWNRIGFTEETQNDRINKLYDKLTEDYTELVEGEEELEQDILESIETKTKKAKKYSVELGLKFDENKLNKQQTVLLKDEWIKKELHRLDQERDMRLNELEKLTTTERKLCQRMKLKTIEQIRTVPHLDDLTNLAKRIKDLEQLLDQRTHEMDKIRTEIARLYQDLDISRSDSFVEAIIYESEDEFQLSEDNINRAKEFHDLLVQKDISITNEIKSIRFKIKEIWQKLNIENNSSLKHFIQSTQELTTTQLEIELKKFNKNKKQLADALQTEYEECIQIKMQNMQKFIDTVRVEIKKLCQLMFFGPKEMQKINNDILDSTDFTEELLQQHEEKLEDLKFKYEESASLYEKTAKWMTAWSDFVQFEEITKDPKRLTQRGYSTLNEQKQRTAFEKQLPKLVADITELADEYANLNGGTSFTINDLYFAEYIERKKYDHEESKLNERKEKQIMKDQIKKNESRFGVSKIKTPLRAKRKITSNNPSAMQSHIHETLMHTPSQRQNKILKIESTLCSTPGLSSTRASNVNTLKPKLSVYDKVKGRKSKTPRKSTRKSLNKRKSRQLKAAIAKLDQNDDTVVSETTMKTTIVSSFASSNTTSRSNTTNTSSVASSSKYHFGHGLMSKAKCPPLSSSSKFTVSSHLQQVMTSTASNSMIDDENFNDIENVDHSVVTVKKPIDKARLLADATAKINKGFQPQVAPNAKFNFGLAPTSLKYDDFSRNINKPNKGLLGETSNLLDSHKSRSRLGS